MARAHYIKAAQKTIYRTGKRVEYVSQKGKRTGQTLTKTDRTIPQDENDPVFIEKGQPYYWWQFKNGPKMLSKIKPRRSQLTQSNYLSQLYDLQDRIDEISASDPEELQSLVEELKDDIQSLLDETQESFDNIPENLQSAPTAELLQERIDALENAVSELDGLDLDYEEPDDEDIKSELEDDEVTPELIEEKKTEKLQEWLDEKTEEIQGISLE